MSAQMAANNEAFQSQGALTDEKVQKAVLEAELARTKEELAGMAAQIAVNSDVLQSQAVLTEEKAVLEGELARTKEELANMSAQMAANNEAFQSQAGMEHEELRRSMEEASAANNEMQRLKAELESMASQHEQLLSQQAALGQEELSRLQSEAVEMKAQLESQHASTHEVADLRVRLEAQQKCSSDLEVEVLRLQEEMERQCRAEAAASNEAAELRAQLEMQQTSSTSAVMQAARSSETEPGKDAGGWDVDDAGMDFGNWDVDLDLNSEQAKDGESPQAVPQGVPSEAAASSRQEELEAEVARLQEQLAAAQTDSANAEVQLTEAAKCKGELEGLHEQVESLQTQMEESQRLQAQEIRSLQSQHADEVATLTSTLHSLRQECEEAQFERTAAEEAAQAMEAAKVQATTEETDDLRAQHASEIAELKSALIALRLEGEEAQRKMAEDAAKAVEAAEVATAEVELQAEAAELAAEVAHLQEQLARAHTASTLAAEQLVEASRCKDDVEGLHAQVASLQQEIEEARQVREQDMEHLRSQHADELATLTSALESLRQEQEASRKEAEELQAIEAPIVEAVAPGSSTPPGGDELGWGLDDLDLEVPGDVGATQIQADFDEAAQQHAAEERARLAQEVESLTKALDEARARAEDEAAKVLHWQEQHRVMQQDSEASKLAAEKLKMELQSLQAQTSVQEGSPGPLEADEVVEADEFGDWDIEVSVPADTKEGSKEEELSALREEVNLLTKLLEEEQLKEESARKAAEEATQVAESTTQALLAAQEAATAASQAAEVNRLALQKAQSEAEKAEQLAQTLQEAVQQAQAKLALVQEEAAAAATQAILEADALRQTNAETLTTCRAEVEQKETEVAESQRRVQSLEEELDAAREQVKQLQDAADLQQRSVDKDAGLADDFDSWDFEGDALADDSVHQEATEASMRFQQEAKDMQMKVRDLETQLQERENALSAATSEASRLEQLLHSEQEKVQKLSVAHGGGQADITGAQDAPPAVDDLSWDFADEGQDVQQPSASTLQKAALEADWSAEVERLSEKLKASEEEVVQLKTQVSELQGDCDLVAELGSTGTTADGALGVARAKEDNATDTEAMLEMQSELQAQAKRCTEALQQAEQMRLQLALAQGRLAHCEDMLKAERSVHSEAAATALRAEISKISQDLIDERQEREREEAELRALLQQTQEDVRARDSAEAMFGESLSLDQQVEVLHRQRNEARSIAQRVARQSAALADELQRMRTTQSQPSSRRARTSHDPERTLHQAEHARPDPEQANPETSQDNGIASGQSGPLLGSTEAFVPPEAAFFDELLHNEDHAEAIASDPAALAESQRPPDEVTSGWDVFDPDTQLEHTVPVVAAGWDFAADELFEELSNTDNTGGARAPPELSPDASAAGDGALGIEADPELEEFLNGFADLP